MDGSCGVAPNSGLGRVGNPGNAGIDGGVKPGIGKDIAGTCGKLHLVAIISPYSSHLMW